MGEHGGLNAIEFLLEGSELLDLETWNFPDPKLVAAPISFKSLYT
jgi:hypothetical protein